MTSHKAAKVIATCLILSVSMQMCSASAIPIWEFLTRNEKMSYLYSTFAQLVSVHCKATAASSTLPVNQCKRNLLSYGYERLQSFNDAQLDILDPYQRGANELIWSSIMRDHASSTLITTRKPLPTPPASSIVILTHQKPSTASTAADTNTDAASASSNSNSNSNTNTQQYPKNPLFDVEAEHKHKFAMDMDIAYGYPGLPTHPQAESFDGVSQPQQPETYLTGPLVFRVRPDGTPVEEDQYKPLPRDDDLESFQLSSRSSNTAPNTTPNISEHSKHRRIATISALKQQQHLALQQELQPPFEQPRVRRQFRTTLAQQLQSPFVGYYYGRGQA